MTMPHNSAIDAFFQKMNKVNKEILKEIDMQESMLRRTIENIRDNAINVFKFVVQQSKNGGVRIKNELLRIKLRFEVGFYSVGLSVQTAIGKVVDFFKSLASFIPDTDIAKKLTGLCDTMQENIRIDSADTKRKKEEKMAELERVESAFFPGSHIDVNSELLESKQSLSAAEILDSAESGQLIRSASH